MCRSHGTEKRQPGKEKRPAAATARPDVLEAHGPEPRGLLFIAYPLAKQSAGTHSPAPPATRGKAVPSIAVLTATVFRGVNR